MQNKQTIIFDFDGTLVDSTAMILASWRHTLDALRLDEPEDLAYCVIGPALRDSWRKLFGMNEDEVEVAVEIYRKYMAKNYGLIEPYDGICELLAELKAQGRTLLIATARSQFTCELILEKAGLAQYFSAVSGDVPEGGQADKALNIGRVLEMVAVSDIASCVMIGDMDTDVDGAKSYGMDCIGVLYGYGGREKLAGASVLVESVAALRGLLRGT
ncbi:MAG: HAD hydrolase-like protein [Oscillospiraceae bacterium]|nr:HAD hydrolase-like protein [Oscillospiraceae bacterium]